MATAPHVYPKSYSGPICGWKTPPKHRIIENIPEVMMIVHTLINTEYYKMAEVTSYTNKINESLKAIDSKLIITRMEYIQMLNRFTKLGNDYIKTCTDRATILSEFSV